jgi:hypothetical protein
MSGSVERSNKQDKRSSPRYTVEGVQGKMLLASQVEILNLSLGGVAIRADRRLNIGSEYTLRLEMADRAVDVKGIVAWSVLTGFRPQGDESVPKYSAGLAFKDVLTDKLRGLIDFIDDNKVSDEQRLGGLRFTIGSGKAELAAPASYRVKLISLSGMLIETSQDLDTDRVYQMEVAFPGEAPIAVSGRVASHVEEFTDAEERHEIGIEFLDLSADDRARLERLIALNGDKR